MNIFFLSYDPAQAARDHCDKHVVKMILESAQMLSTAHHVLDVEGTELLEIHHPYRPTHVNHPCSVWVRSEDGYLWTWQLFVGLCNEFRHRRGKDHKTSRLIEPLSRPPRNVPLSEGWVQPPLAMPDEFKRDDPVSSYRSYYLQKWRDGIVSYDWGRPMPDWLVERIGDEKL